VKFSLPIDLNINMRYEQFVNDDATYAYKINSLSDVLSLDNFKKRSFSSYKDLLGTKTESEAKSIATHVFNSFLSKLSTDLIENNEIFVFPSPGFGYLKVSNTANENRSDYIYDIESDGRVFTPRLKINQEITKRNKKHYRLRFNTRLRTKMYHLIKSGHKYE